MLLLLLVLIPFIGGLLCWQHQRFWPSTDAPRWISLLATAAILVITLLLWMAGDYSLAGTGGVPAWTYEIQIQWIPRFGISLHLALDGLSLVLILLTAFLGVLSVLCSWKDIQDRVGFYHLNLLWLLAGVVGIFLAMDLFLFFFFWEMMLVPMYFLIALWGHSSKGQTPTFAATKFFIYTQASGLLMLACILGLVFAHYSATGELTFDYMDLLGSPVSGALAYALMLGFFVAFAVKLPTVPLHGWLPDAHAQAPTAGSALLAGILLKTAAYGFLRFAVPLFPEASAQFAPVAMGFGLICIYYGAVLALAQDDIKRLIACSSISHMGFILIGVYSGSALAMQGVVLQIVAHGFSSAGLFIIAGQIYERIHTRDMTQMGGLFGRIGSLPGYFLVFVLASLGLPGTANFVAEFLILVGTFDTAPWVAVIASGGLVLAAVYSLVLMHRVNWGPRSTDHTLPGPDQRETVILGSLVGFIVLVGIYPQWVLDLSAQAVGQVFQIFSAAL